MTRQLLDKKLIVTANFAGLMQDAKLDKMQAMANSLAAHRDDFPDPNPPAAEVLAKIAAQRELRNEIKQLQEKQKALTDACHQQEVALTSIFVDRWGPYVQQQADGDTSKVLETGFGIKGQQDGKGEHSHIASVEDSYPLSQQIDTGLPLQHTLYFINSNSAKKAKPTGAERIEIYEKIDGAAPASLREMIYVGATSKPAFINHFEAEQKGKTIYYAFRYVDTHNQPGPHSPVQSAVITG